MRKSVKERLRLRARMAAELEYLSSGKLRHKCISRLVLVAMAVDKAISDPVHTECTVSGHHLYVHSEHTISENFNDTLSCLSLTLDLDSPTRVHRHLRVCTRGLPCSPGYGRGKQSHISRQLANVKDKYYEFFRGHGGKGLERNEGMEEG